MRGSTAARRSIDSVDLVGSALTSHRALRGIRFDALLSQVLRELPAPIAQRRLLDVQPHPLFADRFDRRMYVRMGLVRMKRERVTVLERELFSQETSRRIEHALRRRAG